MENTKSQSNYSNRDGLSELLVKASKLDERKLGYRSQGEWKELREANGARNLKVAALGRFGRTRMFSPEQLAEVLHKAGIASSIEEGRKLIPYFANSWMQYSYGLFPLSLTIDGVQDYNGKTAYLVKARRELASDF